MATKVKSIQRAVRAEKNELAAQRDPGRAAVRAAMDRRDRAGWGRSVWNSGTK